jgi:hypothetical protein
VGRAPWLSQIARGAVAVQMRIWLCFEMLCAPAVRHSHGAATASGLVPKVDAHNGIFKPGFHLKVSNF